MKKIYVVKLNMGKNKMKINKYLLFCSIIVDTAISINLFAATGDSNKAFLNAEAILAGWESTYGSIRTMRVSYHDRLVDYIPPASNPNEPSPVKYQHTERIEEGKRYYTRYSSAEDGFNKPESITEYAFNGKTTQAYQGSVRHGTIVTGLTNSMHDTKNDLKEHMMFRTIPTPDVFKDEYPNEIPRLAFYFKIGMLNGKITIRPNLEMVAGQLCHVVEILSSGAARGKDVEFKRVYWMAHEKSMCLMKYQHYLNDKLDEEMEVKQIAKANMDGIDIWYLKKASRASFDEDLGTSKNELIVTEFIPNIEVDENTFRFDFLPGTEVYDRVLGLSYVVAGVGLDNEVSPVYIVEPIEEMKKANDDVETTTDSTKFDSEEKSDDSEEITDNEKNKEDEQIPIEPLTENNKIIGVKNLSILGVVIITITGLLFWYRHSAKT